MMLQLLPGPSPWFYRAVFGYHEGLISELKKLPGCSYYKPADVGPPSWLIPSELYDYSVKKTILAYGFKIENKTNKAPYKNFPDASGISKALHPYQTAAVCKSLRTSSFLYNDPMGLGKTPEVLQSLYLRQARRILVAVPAIARRTWELEIAKWFPMSPDVFIIKTRKQAADVDPNCSGFFIVSYSLLQYLPSDLSGFDAVVYDEIHLLQAAEAKRTKAARKRSKRCIKDGGFIGGLTGTLITNNVSSAWQPLDLLFPAVDLMIKDRDDQIYLKEYGRFGTRFQFQRRYMNGTQDQYGWHWEGLNEENKKELEYRLKYISSRVSISEVAHLLPPFLVQTLYLDNKLSGTCDFARNAHAGGSKYICLLTDRRQTAKDIADRLRKGTAFRDVPIEVITGAVSPENRHRVLEKLKDAKCGIICATMHALNTSIDLTFVNTVGIVEIPSRVDHLAQVLGRFWRLTGVDPVSVTILGSSSGDRAAQRMFERIKGINAVIDAGRHEGSIEGFTKEMRLGGKSEEEVLQLVAELAEECEEMGW